MAMRFRSLAALLTIPFWLLSLPSLRAASRSAEPRPDLVVVLNTNPSNPLGGEIWLMDLSGRLLRRVTRNDYHEERPQFSPDGSRIVFVRNLGGIAPGIGLDPKRNEIFIYDLRTGAETRLTRNDVEDGSPEWSFDGKTIAFFSRRNHPEGKATLWVMQADGSRPRQITALQPGDISHMDSNWGPDGQWLAFANYRAENGRRFSRIEKIRLDGSQRTVISSGGQDRTAGGAEKGEPPGDVDPTHSPDGAMIWSARRLDDGRTHLFAFGAGTYYGGAAPWNDPNLIGAIFKAYDRRQLIQQFHGGRGAMAGSVPPTQAAFGIDEGELVTFDGYKEDRDKEITEARAMWAAGGGPALGEITLDIPDIFEPLYQGSSVLTSMLNQNLGTDQFKAKIEPYSTITTKIVQQQYGNGHNNIWYGWITELTDPEPSSFLVGNFKSDSPLNFQYKVAVDGLDPILEKLALELDQEKRQGLAKDAERLILKAYGAGIPYSHVQITNTLYWNYYHAHEAAPFSTAHLYVNSWIDKDDPTYQGRPSDAGIV